MNPHFSVMSPLVWAREQEWLPALTYYLFIICDICINSSYVCLISGSRRTSCELFVSWTHGRAAPCWVWCGENGRAEGVGTSVTAHRRQCFNSSDAVSLPFSFSSSSMNFFLFPCLCLHLSLHIHVFSLRFIYRSQVAPQIFSSFIFPSANTLLFRCWFFSSLRFLFLTPPLLIFLPYLPSNLFIFIYLCSNTFNISKPNEPLDIFRLHREGKLLRGVPCQGCWGNVKTGSFCPHWLKTINQPCQLFWGKFISSN